jgi:dTDP-4-dehydrorhamnose reductase
LKRIYITGAQGMLGMAVSRLFSERYELLPADLEEVDIRQSDLIIEDICRHDPDMVLHLAAMTDVDRCEVEPDEAYRVNALGTRNVALACQRTNAVMLYVNTGSIYDGSKETPYIEYDAPGPVNVYGRSKYAGELYVRELLSRYYIFYTCWMFGGGPEDKKFVAKIIDLARNNRELRVVDDKRGSPTYTVDMASAMFRFVESGLYGRYHCVNAGSVNRFDVAAAVIEAAGIEGCSLLPVSSSEFDLPAPRPANESMRNYNFELLGLDMMRDWRSALFEYVSSTFV